MRFTALPVRSHSGVCSGFGLRYHGRCNHRSGNDKSPAAASNTGRVLNVKKIDAKAGTAGDFGR